MVIARIAFFGMSMSKKGTVEHTTRDLTRSLLEKGYGVTWLDVSPNAEDIKDIPDGCVVEHLAWGETPLSLKGINKKDLMSFGLKALYDQDSPYATDLLSLTHAMEACKADTVIAWGTLATRYALDTVVAGTTVVSGLTRNPKRDIGLQLLERDMQTKNYMMRVRAIQTPAIALANAFPAKYKRKFIDISHTIEAGKHVIDPVGKKDQTKYIVYAGELIETADVDALLYAYQHIAQDHADWNLRIIGSGPERKGLIASAHARGLDGRTEFIEADDNYDDYFADAQLFVSPSTYDAFPATLLLAGSCGFPLIATSETPVVSRVIKPDINGIIIPEISKTKELFKALTTMIEDDEKRAFYGKNSMTLINNNFVRPNYTSKWIDLIIHACPLLSK